MATDPNRDSDGNTVVNGRAPNIEDSTYGVWADSERLTSLSEGVGGPTGGAR